VTRAHRALKVNQVVKGQLEFRVPMALLVSKVLVESSARMDNRDLQVRVDFKVLLAHLVNLEIQARRASKVVLVRMETLGQQARLVHLDNKASPAIREPVVILVHLVTSDKWEHQVMIKTVV